MSSYNPLSFKAEEFIADSEIRETLEYAEKNKDNLPLIEEILNKARPKKTDTGYTCQGLTHREASVLLACEDKEILKKIYEIAEEIKLAFYGNRIEKYPIIEKEFAIKICDVKSDDLFIIGNAKSLFFSSGGVKHS